MKKIVIIGGGIAGSSCIDTLIQEFSDDSTYNSITLLSADTLIKRATSYVKRGRNLEEFEVSTVPVDNYADLQVPDNLDLKIRNCLVESVDEKRKLVNIQIETNNCTRNELIPYDILCICTGSKPKSLVPPKGLSDEVQDLIFTIRDITSIDDLSEKIATCDRVAVIGNGGIGIDMVNKISGCDIVWIVRDDFVGRPFMDSEACKFILDDLVSHREKSHIDQKNRENRQSQTISKLDRVLGPALGPGWDHSLTLSGRRFNDNSIQIKYACQVERIDYDKNAQHKVQIYTDTSELIECDIIISAIGVEPNVVEFVHASLEVSQHDGGIIIDEQMTSSIKGHYAAGDVVSCEKWPRNELWFQMRLWTQARQMGYYCARCITSHLANENPSIYFPFDCFSHSTKFFNKRIILLGSYNGQNLKDDELKMCEVYIRENPGHDYVKILLRHEVIIGAVLVGLTGLEETFENLICDRVNVADIKDQLLEETVDIEDYFD